VVQPRNPSPTPSLKKGKGLLYYCNMLQYVPLPLIRGGGQEVGLRGSKHIRSKIKKSTSSVDSCNKNELEPPRAASDPNWCRGGVAAGGGSVVWRYFLSASMAGLIPSTTSGWCRAIVCRRTSIICRVLGLMMPVVSALSIEQRASARPAPFRWVALSSSSICTFSISLRTVSPMFMFTSVCKVDRVINE